MGLLCSNTIFDLSFIEIFYQGTLENFRQQWKKEVKVNKEEWQEENSSFESLNANDSENVLLKEAASKKVERDIEKKVCIPSKVMLKYICQKPAPGEYVSKISANFILF